MTALPRARVDRALMVASAVVLGLGIAVLQPVGIAAAVPVVPAAVGLPAAIEPLPVWDGVQWCDPVARPGVIAMKKLLAKTYGSTSFGITRSCSGGSGTSEHNEGRALDWMISGKAEVKNAEAFLDWVLAKDADGNKQAMARRMGLMYIIWDNRMFRLYDPSRGWTEYSNCLSTLSSSSDTTCHRDHVHLSFTWDGAAAKTSYWSGKAMTAPACTTYASRGTAPSVPKTGQEFVAIRPTMLLDTARAVGVDSRCRLTRADSAGDRNRIDLKVAGRGGVPLTGVSAVSLSIEVRGPNAPTKLFVEPTGSPWPRLRVVTTGLRVNGLGAVTVPLGSSGRVSLTIPTGAADVRVHVVGYYVAPTSETLQFHPAQPKRLLDTVADSTKFKAGQARAVAAEGRAGLPAKNVEAVALAVTVSGGTEAGGVVVYGPEDKAPGKRVESVYSPAGKQRTNVVIARVGEDGSVQVRNDAAGARHVRMDVLGWWSVNTIADGSQFMLLKPKEIVDSTEGKGIGARLKAGSTSDVSLAGIGGIAADGVTAVALQLTAVQPGSDTVLVAMESGTESPKTRSASPRYGLDNTAWVVAPLADGAAALRSTKAAVDVRAYSVGYWFLP